MKWSRASVLPRVSPRPKRGGLLSSSRAMLKMAACAGIAPATLTSSPAGSLALPGCAPLSLSRAAFGVRVMLPTGR